MNIGHIVLMILTSVFETVDRKEQLADVILKKGSFETTKITSSQFLHSLCVYSEVLNCIL
jgi:hypothetical protein